MENEKQRYYIVVDDGEIYFYKTKSKYFDLGDDAIEVNLDHKIHLIRWCDHEIDDGGAVKGNNKEEILENLKQDILENYKKYKEDWDECFENSEEDEFASIEIEFPSLNYFELDYYISEQNAKDYKENNIKAIVEDFANRVFEFIANSEVDGDSSWACELVKFEGKQFKQIARDFYWK